MNKKILTWLSLIAIALLVMLAVCQSDALAKPDKEMVTLECSEKPAVEYVDNGWQVKGYCRLVSDRQEEAEEPAAYPEPVDPAYPDPGPITKCERDWYMFWECIP